jgi:hypothetical protein
MRLDNLDVYHIFGATSFLFWFTLGYFKGCLFRHKLVTACNLVGFFKAKSLKLAESDHCVTKLTL